MPPDPRPLDDIDAQLLDLLQVDADRTLRQLGDVVGLSPSAVQRRLTRYRAEGLLRTVAVVDARARGVVRAVVLVTLAEESRDHHARISARLAAHPSVQHCWSLSGRWEYAAVVVAGSVEELAELNDRLFKDDENVRRFDTLVVLREVTSSAALPSELLVRASEGPRGRGGSRRG